MSYADLPRYWMVPLGRFLRHPQLEQLIWPNGLPEGEYLGEFYHVSQQHANASLIALLVGDCEVKHINRTELTFPRWLRSRAGDHLEHK
jgi:hypothetical protein